MHKEVEQYIDMFCQMLKSENLKCTQIRESILRVFFTNEHLDVEKIVQKLRDDFNVKSTKQSVYATLNLLQSYKIISKQTQNSEIFYELTRHSNHFHLVCEKCKKYIEFKDKEIVELIEKLALKDKFHISQLDVSIYGTCQKCNAKILS